MRRALHATRGGSCAARPAPADDRLENAEYVINWPAIAGSLGLLVVLAGAPLVMFACWPALGQSWQGRQPVVGGPLLVSVEHQVHTTPPPPANNPLVEALRQREAREAEADSATRNDATRRIVRPRRRKPARQIVDKANEEASRRSDRLVPNNVAPLAVDVVDAKSAIEVAENTPATEDGRHLRLNILREAELLDQLRTSVPELRLDDKGEVAGKLIAAARKKQAKSEAENSNESKDAEASAESDALPDSSALRKLVAGRDDLAGLPFGWDRTCKKEGKSLKALCEVSQTVRALDNRTSAIPRTFRNSTAAQSDYKRLWAIAEKLNDPKLWRSPEHVPALEQMLTTESISMSLELVEALSQIRGTEASQALARRALFDISPGVRTAAIEALRKRDAAEYRGELTAGLRYPWAPAAINAADALIELDVQEAVPELVEMLDLPAPTMPYRDQRGRWVVRELVKVNHLRNCVLCHAPVDPAARATLSGFVPTPGKPLPQRYYGAPSGDFVRADVTYLRQDFSVMEFVGNSKPWPALQRFDFMVRTRVLPPKAQARLDASPPTPEDSPQRDALLYTLRHLTGKDGGDDPQRWRELVGGE